MPIVTTGTGYSGGTRLIGADGGGTGTATVTGEPLLLDTVYAAREDGEGTLTLEGGSTITVRDLSGDPATVFPANVDVGFTNDPAQPSTGRLEVLGGSSLTVETSQVFDQNGFVLGGYNALRIGEGPGATGVALVSGAGSSIETAGGAPGMSVGENGGNGTLTVENGGELRLFEIEAGKGGGGSVGRVTIDGPGSRIVTSSAYGVYGPAYAGAQGYSGFGRGEGAGYLTIRNGGQFLARNVDGETDRPFLRFARDAGSYGLGVVDGAGSSLDLEQIGSASDARFGGALLMVGDGGSGVLRARNGAQVNVLGDDALLLVSDGRDYAGQYSLLEITTGADVLVDSQKYGGSPNSGQPFYRGSDVIAGVGLDTNGRVRVDGAGSTLTVASNTDLPGDYTSGKLSIGRFGTARLDVSDGAMVEARQLRVGVASVGKDRDGNDATAFFGYLYAPENAGNGTVNVAGGGQIKLTATSATPFLGLELGISSGTTGTVTVDGAGSTLTSQGGAGEIRVGRNGSAELFLVNGGTAEGFSVSVGQRIGSDGLLNVQGAGSQLLVSDAFGTFDGYTIGGFLNAGRQDASFGRIIVQDGGTISVQNAPGSVADAPLMQLARETGSVGVLEIDGAGSSVNLTLTGPSDDALVPGQTYGAYAVIGRGGEGRATVYNAGALNVSGEDSRLFVGGNIPEPEQNVGTTGTGELLIASGGSVSVTGADAVTSIASGSGNAGLIRVEEAGSALNAGALLLVGAGWDEETDSVTGAGGSAFLDIAGGSVSAGCTIVGAGSGMDGDGALAGDLEVHGELSLKPGNTAADQGALDLTGDLTLMPRAELEFGVAEFDTDTGGTIAVQGDADFGLKELRVDLRLLDPSVAPGDAFRLATVTGTLEPGLRFFARDDMAFSLGTVGGDLFLNAVDLAGDDAVAGTAGADGLLGGAGQDTLTGGGGDDILAGGDGDDSLDGGPDVDILSFAEEPGAAVGAGAALVTGGVDIALGAGTGTDGSGGTDSWENVEGLEGTVFDDRLAGDGGANRLLGGEGSDDLTGGAGPDTLEGGAGFDKALYEASPAAVEIDLTAPIQRGGDAEGDVLTGIEEVRASDFGDRLIGDADFQVLTGGAGPDTLTGGPGDDQFDATLATLDGDRITDFAPGDRIKLFDVEIDAAAIAASDDGTDTTLTLAEGGESATLTLDGLFAGFRLEEEVPGITGVFAIETEGGPGGDFLPGGTEAEHIRGFGGDDVIGGSTGADTLDGGQGFDNVEYFASPDPVNVDLTRAVQSGGHAEGDVLIGIEGVGGSAGDDTLAGDDRVTGNFLNGASGADLMTGGGGRDAFGSNFFELDGDRITDFGSDDEILVFDRAAGALDLAVADDGADTAVTLQDAGGAQVTLALDGLFEEVVLEETASGDARLTARPAEAALQAGVTRGTPGDDLMLIGQNSAYLPLAGADRLILSPAARADAISAVEAEAGDSLQLTEGLEIRSFDLRPAQLELVTAAGAVLRIGNADLLSYEIGANATTLDPGTALDYASFARDILGTAVPDTDPVTGGPLTVTEDALL